MSIIRKSVIVGIAAALASPVIMATGSFAAVTPAVSHTYATKIASVHVRSQPTNAKGSKIVAVLGAAGTHVAVTCSVRVIAGGTTHTWYRATQPAGYIAGRNLVLPAHKQTGLPAC